MKLKTLKDFNINRYNKKGETLYRGLDPSQMDALREEAIKHIKKLRISKVDKFGTIIGTPQAIEIERWIKHFFNITEEDLK